MTITKTKKGYQLKSKTTGKSLGTAKTKAAILKRERQVQFFKNNAQYIKDHGKSIPFRKKKK